ncbi:MAG TPA: SDR family NAD(P)-dependent oxidoreductase [Pyrinomonadaceae bacterium]|nr:SDR family NAD(P)-dependent oxidoreductase [Pyrinomonadaceae bacterium]HRK48881.1 SDR family NAD(P)-dependent oxidoreductase [Pyrinomonadaceae bacterium]
MTLRKDSVAVITGAGSGIGRALAKRLAAEGIVGLAIADVNREGLEETAMILGDANVSLHVVDVADRAAMASFVDAVISEHGRVTHVINNAGVALGGTLKEVSLDEIEWLMGVNFWGVVHGTKLFLPYLVKEPEAHIVNISSLFGLVAPPGQTAYCASKFAVRGFTEALRHELEDTNIAVSVVHPGGVKTNIANSARIAESSEITADELEQRLARMNRNLSTTTPDRAAEIIIKGIKKRSPRIIVGPDAQLLSWIQRLFPKRYLAIANAISGGKLKET